MQLLTVRCVKEEEGEGEEEDSGKEKEGRCVSVCESFTFNESSALISGRSMASTSARPMCVSGVMVEGVGRRVCNGSCCAVWLMGHHKERVRVSE